MAGIQVLVQSLATGRPCVQLHGLSAEQVLERIQAMRITHLSATPSFFRFLLPAFKGRTPSSVLQLTLGGECFDPALAEQLRDAFPAARICNVYASTEAGSLFVSSGDCFEVKPALTQQVKVVDGELWIASDLLGKGCVESDWYATGDRVEVLSSEPLRFRFAGRESATINVGGYTIYPEKIEAALCAHPAVAQAHVYGRPQALIGNLLMADWVAVVEAPTPSERELRCFLSETCQAHEIPRILKEVNQLQHTPTGKILRR
jgi:acyl-coenzyme A synthetase/AMP-(fatty) acid ligase